MAVHPGPTRLRSSTFDVVAGVLTAAFLVAVTTHVRVEPGHRDVDATAVAVLLAAAVAVGIARRLPEVAVVIVTAVLSVYLVRDYPGGPVWVTGWVALASLTWRRTRAVGLAGAAFFCGVLLVVAAVDRDLSPLLHLVFVGWSIAAVFAGDALRARRERLAELEARARELEHTREEEARRRVAEDRLRIARDLHDSVAHAMATINVQAGAAAHVVDRRPEAAKEALTAIQRASGDVLDELAALLGLLRNADETAERAPTPGREAIRDLVASARAAGIDVAVAVDGPLDDVPPPVCTAAYRIVQESLTNVIRHAPGASARVTVHAGDGGALSVEVVDDGTPARRDAADHAGTGMGLRGMRERADATGGSLHAAPGPGGFVVRATWGDAS